MVTDSRRYSISKHIAAVKHHVDVLKKAQKVREIELFRIRKKLTDQEKIAIYKKFSLRVDQELEEAEVHFSKIFEEVLSPKEKTHPRNQENQK